MSDQEKLLSVENLELVVPGLPETQIVRGVGFEISPGEMVGLVGESGSGKTMLGRAIVGLQPGGIVRRGGTIRLRGKDLSQMSPRELRQMRGDEVSIVFQEPMTSLNPSMTIGRQLDEPLRTHTKLRASERRARIIAMMERVGIPGPEERLEDFPHEFSGGMRQRIMLASAMLLKPALLIADEPTTALDALVQREVLELMVEMTRENGTSLILISHDLPMVARYCERIMVMRQGELVEQGKARQILATPAHDYTRKLLAAMPERGPLREFDEDEIPLVELRDLKVEYVSRGGLLSRANRKLALKGASLSVRRGEVVAVVGASGSGKTTLGRALAHLIPHSGGEILFRGEPVRQGGKGWMDFRLNCQMIFQDPFGSLDPRFPIRRALAEALYHVDLSLEDKEARIRRIVTEVGLEQNHLDRLPHEMSGGQRQRVAIARAIISEPDFVIADEAVSALDVTVRAQVLDLLADLQRRHGFSCLFISHDLGVVEQLADRVVVMRDGEIVEAGSRDGIFDSPQSGYTRALLSAIPTLKRTGTGVELSWRFDAPEAWA
ncbi:dipeptide ABC transporter ATP-binding protein [Qingshengfaniella alkalisoli]|uniref:ABC transporter ATP-binding protein n=1 Tax=Qingshengfaniella alkalisoli TaxID=2599296 RepID=A0A5B8IXH7_9RHOB|nr:ABC transporter ATP-binding protein [Qingshengfaniella alkalisoli]QDY70353.1 ABC transporter ATP-binding protein [Qingshengfaniella alkalisoli]